MKYASLVTPFFEDSILRQSPDCSTRTWTASPSPRFSARTHSHRSRSALRRSVPSNRRLPPGYPHPRRAESPSRWTWQILAGTLSVGHSENLQTFDLEKMGLNCIHSPTEASSRACVDTSSTRAADVYCHLGLPKQWSSRRGCCRDRAALSRSPHPHGVTASDRTAPLGWYPVKWGCAVCCQNWTVVGVDYYYTIKKQKVLNLFRNLWVWRSNRMLCTVTFAFFKRSAITHFNELLSRSVSTGARIRQLSVGAAACFKR